MTSSSSKVVIELDPVQETLMIPLMARAAETRKYPDGSGMVHDPKAVEIVEAVEYDFDKLGKGQSLWGATLRTSLFDDMVNDFLAEYPKGTVVEVGCGLNTRYERLDNGQATFLDLDLPDVIELRKQFFDYTATPRRTMIAASVLEAEWLEQVAKIGGGESGAYCFVSEAVIIYLQEKQVKQAITQIGNRFGKSKHVAVLTDTTSAEIVDNQQEHPVMKNFEKKSWFQWKCDDPSIIEDWPLRDSSQHFHLVQSKTFLDASEPILARMTWYYRCLAKYAGFLIRKKVQGYQINVLILALKKSKAAAADTKEEL